MQLAPIQSGFSFISFHNLRDVIMLEQRGFVTAEGVIVLGTHAKYKHMSSGVG